MNNSSLVLTTTLGSTILEHSQQPNVSLTGPDHPPAPPPRALITPFIPDPKISPLRPSSIITHQSSFESSSPRPLPSNLAPVPAFDVDHLLPHTLRGYVIDCAERLQVDASFIAVPLIISLGAVLGNRLGLRPKMHDDWTEFPNLWGAVIGRPSTLKSPALSAALRPLSRLEGQANEAHQLGLTDWKKTQAAADINRAAAKSRAVAAARKGEDFDPAQLLPADDEPACRRFLTNDATPEALHALLSRPVNSTGVMVFSDELSGLLSRLNDPDRGGALRAFMLSAWSGHQAAVVDRVGRGENLRVDRCCVSVLGGIQPGKLAPLVEGALKESIHDDGWLQRLSLLVWPDAPTHFAMIDRLPDSPAYAEILRLFEHAETTPGAAWPGAQYDEHRRESYLRFEPMAAAHFKEWLEHETQQLRTHELTPALESHFFKYRKTVCALALLFHIAADPTNEQVPLIALIRALNWIDYLKPHAHRVYNAHKNNTAETAQRILAKLKSGELGMTFKARDIKQNHWSGLTDGVIVEGALDMLMAYGWLREEAVEMKAQGRPTKAYFAHPALKAAAA